MARNILIVIVVLVVLLLAIWPSDNKVWQHVVLTKSTIVENQKTDKNAISSETKKGSEAVKKPAKLSPDEQYHIDQMLKEVGNPEYSSDPFVEASVQQLKMFGCDMFSQSWLSAEMHQHNSEAWVKKTTQQCDVQKQKRPRLYFAAKKFVVNKNIPSTSTWGQRMKAMDTLNHSERRVFNGEFLRFALRQQQAHWLMLATLNGESHAFDYETWVNSNNDRYSRIIQEAALNLLLCEWDDTNLCAPSSMIMVISCANTPGDCGLSYPEWFEKNHMPGFKKDVALVLAKLKAYSNGEDVE